MSNLIIFLFAGHLVGDFLLQNRDMAEAKSRVKTCLLHALIVASFTWLLIGAIYPKGVWLMVFLVFLTHLLIDTLKSFDKHESVRTFLVDQAAHGLVLIIIAGLFSQMSYACIWLHWIPMYMPFLIIIIGLVLCIWFGSVLISRAMAPITLELQEELSTGLKNGGRWIGQLERALTYLLVLSGNSGAIGFLFTAKSILRFGEIKKSGQRKEAEYIIIGTFMSFGWALLVAISIQKWLSSLQMVK